MGLEVQRDLDMKMLAVQAVFKLPIVWMSGSYKWSKARIMKIIPYFARGHFNIDMKQVTVGFIAVLRIKPPTPEKKDNVRLDTFEVGLSWKDTSFHFDGAPKGLRTITSLTLNQVTTTTVCPASNAL